MTIRHLKLYIEVFKTMNITKAAENLCMTQPTVTRAIQELEDHYQVKLFDRINKRLRATENGEKFYSYALKTVEAFDHMEDSMFGWNDNEVIRIGTTISIGSVLVPRLIRMFNQKYPNVQIRTTINNSEYLQEKLWNNQIDFALMEGYVPTEHVICEVLSEDRLVLLLPPDDQRCKKGYVSLNELKNDSFLLREKGSVSRNYVDVLFSSHGLPINPVMESVSTHAIIRAVNAGLGVAILPEDMVEHSISSGYVGSCQIQEVSMTRSNYIVWYEGKFITNKMRKLMEMCKELA